MSIWIAIGATALGCYLLKLLGLSIPAGLLERPAVRRSAALVPVALLAALTALQTFAKDGGLTLDARALGLAAAALAAWRRAPFLLVVGLAVGVTAAARLLG